MRNKIGIGISTYKRPKALSMTIKRIAKYAPPEAQIVIVSDYDTNVIVECDYIFPEHVGIATVKNKCLELLQECEHIFLFDDDCYPISDDWFKPYIESKEPHLMYIFTSENGVPDRIKEIHRTKDIVSYNHVKGCMLYFDRRVLGVVGGFDTDYEMYEHTDLTNRIYNAGLTTYRVMDVPNSHNLIYSMDEHQEVVSTINKPTLIPDNRRLKIKNKHSKEYKPFQ